jgi:F-type H+-transporting ATPase subunit epsilon
MALLTVQVVSPERVLYTGEGEMVVARTVSGDAAFLPGHAPFLGTLVIGKVRVVLPAGGEHGEQVIAVHGGFIEVGADHVTVLSDVAELPEQIDAGRAYEAKAAAERKLADASPEELPEIQAAIARADLRLDIASGAHASA